MSERRSGRTRAAYKNRLASRVDKGLFLGTLLIGVAAIVFLKLRGFGQFAVTATPCLLMIAYVVLVVSTRRFRLREDLAADNAYYLGFLYTLTSLSLALYQFSDGGGADAVISNFGIALATTILGLALRVVLGQFREDPVEIEREARLELSEAASRLRSELDATVLDLNSFRRATQQSIAEGMEEVTKRSGEALSQNVERMASVAAAVMEKIDTAFAAHAGSAERLNEASGRTVRAVEELAARIERIEAPSDLVTARLQPTADALLAAAEAARTRALADQERAAEVSRALAQAVEAAATLRQEAASFAERAEGAGSLLGRLAAAGEILDASLGALARRTAEQDRLLSEGREAAELALRDFEESLRRHAEAREATLRSLAQATDESAGLIRRHNEGIGEELRRTRQLYATVEASLVSMADLLVERLGGTGIGHGGEGTPAAAAPRLAVVDRP